MVGIEGRLVEEGVVVWPSTNDFWPVGKKNDVRWFSCSNLSQVTRDYNIVVDGWAGKSNI